MDAPYANPIPYAAPVRNPSLEAMYTCRLDEAKPAWDGERMPREKKQRGLGVTRLWRSPNAKDTTHEGTYNMQRESLMLSRLRMYWQVIW